MREARSSSWGYDGMMGYDMWRLEDKLRGVDAGQAMARRDAPIRPGDAFGEGPVAGGLIMTRARGPPHHAF